MSTGRNLYKGGRFFFESQCLATPELPDRDVIRGWVQFREVSSADLDTCTYGSRVIRIGDDKWDSGCVPHEIGHAACDYLGQPIGCPDFEHVSAIKSLGC